MPSNLMFNIKDKVFVKRRGNPAWPAIIYGVKFNHSSRLQYSVYLYGTGKRAECKLHELFSYEHHKHTFSNPQGKVPNLKYFNEALIQIESDFIPSVFSISKFQTPTTPNNINIINKKSLINKFSNICDTQKLNINNSNISECNKVISSIESSCSVSKEIKKYKGEDKLKDDVQLLSFNKSKQFKDVKIINKPNIRTQQNLPTNDFNFTKKNKVNTSIKNVCHVKSKKKKRKICNIKPKVNNQNVISQRKPKIKQSNAKDIQILSCKINQPRVLLYKLNSDIIEKVIHRYRKLKNENKYTTNTQSFKTIKHSKSIIKTKSFLRSNNVLQNCDKLIHNCSILSTDTSSNICSNISHVSHPGFNDQKLDKENKLIPDIQNVNSQIINPTFSDREINIEEPKNILLYKINKNLYINDSRCDKSDYAFNQNSKSTGTKLKPKFGSLNVITRSNVKQKLEEKNKLITDTQTVKINNHLQSVNKTESFLKSNNVLPNCDKTINNISISSTETSSNICSNISRVSQSGFDNYQKFDEENKLIPDIQNVNNQIFKPTLSDCEINIEEPNNVLICKMNKSININDSRSNKTDDSFNQNTNSSETKMNPIINTQNIITRSHAKQKLYESVKNKFSNICDTQKLNINNSNISEGNKVISSIESSCCSVSKEIKKYEGEDKLKDDVQLLSFNKSEQIKDVKIINKPNIRTQQNLPTNDFNFTKKNKVNTSIKNVCHVKSIKKKGKICNIKPKVNNDNDISQRKTKIKQKKTDNCKQIHKIDNVKQKNSKIQQKLLNVDLSLTKESNTVSSVQNIAHKQVTKGTKRKRNEVTHIKALTKKSMPSNAKNIQNLDCKIPRVYLEKLNIDIREIFYRNKKLEKKNITDTQNVKENNHQQYVNKTESIINSCNESQNCNSIINNERLSNKNCMSHSGEIIEPTFSNCEINIEEPNNLLLGKMNKSLNVNDSRCDKTDDSFNQSSKSTDTKLKPNNVLPNYDIPINNISISSTETSSDLSSNISHVSHPGFNDQKLDKENKLIPGIQNVNSQIINTFSDREINIEEPNNVLCKMNKSININDSRCDKTDDSFNQSSKSSDTKLKPNNVLPNYDIPINNISISSTETSSDFSSNISHVSQRGLNNHQKLVKENKLIPDMRYVNSQIINPTFSDREINIEEPNNVLCKMNKSININDSRCDKTDDSFNQNTNSSVTMLKSKTRKNSIKRARSRKCFRNYIVNKKIPISDMMINSVSGLKIKFKKINSKESYSNHSLRIELLLLYYVHKLLLALQINLVDYKMALNSLESISKLDINCIMLIKQQCVVEAIEKVTMYVGNVNELNLNQEETVIHNEMACIIRHKAQNVFDKFVSLFNVCEGQSFHEVYRNHMINFSIKNQHLTNEQLCLYTSG